MTTKIILLAFLFIWLFWWFFFFIKKVAQRSRIHRMPVQAKVVSGSYFKGKTAVCWPSKNDPYMQREAILKHEGFAPMLYEITELEFVDAKGKKVQWP